MNCQAFVETLNNSLQQTSHIAICLAKRHKDHVSLIDNLLKFNDFTCWKASCQSHLSTPFPPIPQPTHRYVGF